MKELADLLQRQVPGRNGFSNQNLWRMKQFYEGYADAPKLSPPVTEIGPVDRMQKTPSFDDTETSTEEAVQLS